MNQTSRRLPQAYIQRRAAKIREMFDRFVVDKTLAGRQALAYAIANGSGSIWLNLTNAQYTQLNRVAIDNKDRK